MLSKRSFCGSGFAVKRLLSHPRKDPLRPGESAGGHSERADKGYAGAETSGSSPQDASVHANTTRASNEFAHNHSTEKKRPDVKHPRSVVDSVIAGTMLFYIGVLKQGLPA